MKITRFVVLALLAASGSAQAQFAPTGTFGDLNTLGLTPAPTYTSNNVNSGIPVNRSMFSQFNGVTIALSATQRYTSPALGMPSNGYFTTTTGYSTGAPANFPNSKWNLDYYIEGAHVNMYYYLLTGTFTPLNGSLQQGNPQLMPNSGYQDSFNVPGGVDPSGALANAAGLWTFQLQQYESVADHTGDILRGTVAVDVEVDPTPEPASLVLIGTGLLGVAAVARRRRKA